MEKTHGSHCSEQKSKIKYLHSFVSIVVKTDTDKVDAGDDPIMGDGEVEVKDVELSDEEENFSCSLDGELADCILEEMAFVVEDAKISDKNKL
jgi:hypothetical protein